MLSVLIPSRTASNLIPCVSAVRALDPSVQIVVVNDGITPSAAFAGWDGAYWLIGAKPFIFARNINLAIRASGSDDCLLLNDDALLKTPGGFTLMRKAAEEHPEYGVISAATNIACNPAQNLHRGMGLREEPRMVAFVCVLIPRRTINLVGLLDERFGGTTPDGRTIYGFCDNDYCRRVREAGLKIGILDSCFVDHGSLRSTFRGDPRASLDIRPAAEIYQAKWGSLD
jgi:GT2 family glycosyltransferase